MPYCTCTVRTSLGRTVRARTVLVHHRWPASLPTTLASSGYTWACTSSRASVVPSATANTTASTGGPGIPAGCPAAAAARRARAPSNPSPTPNPNPPNPNPNPSPDPYPDPNPDPNPTPSPNPNPNPSPNPDPTQVAVLRVRR